ncbi:hypothetical protein T4D_11 [Trichinella pseudospiralis]|uniref:Uncharacterized protein n=1 Tax=Trichinella pseudospiralis TaxID=6337 RepID=A0A0V1FCG1_TRIPS|nr:hypothetical protein T4D_11 [Trichinella pseudospiralis]
MVNTFLYELNANVICNAGVFTSMIHSGQINYLLLGAIAKYHGKILRILPKETVRCSNNVLSIDLCPVKKSNDKTDFPASASVTELFEINFKMERRDYHKNDFPKVDRKGNVAYQCSFLFSFNCSNNINTEYV